MLNNRALAALRLPARGSARFGAPARGGRDMEPGSSDLLFNLGWALPGRGRCRGGRLLAARAGAARAAATTTPASSSPGLSRRAGREAEAEEEWKALSAVSSSYRSLQAPDLGPALRAHPGLGAPRRCSTTTSQQRRDGGHAPRRGRDALAEAGDLEGALGELTRAAYLDPYVARVHRQLGRAASAARRDREGPGRAAHVALVPRRHGGPRRSWPGS